MIETKHIFKKLYSYQKDAVTSTLYDTKGIVCMPTGVGKTYCQASIIANDIMLNPNQFRMYVVNAPRILLTYQLLKEIYGFLVENNIEARYMFVHSGRKADEKELEEIRTQANAEGANIPFSEIISGTSTTVIKEMIDKSKEQSLPLIFFSTYNSANNIEYAKKDIKQPISIVLNDEAHYLVQEQFHDILKTLTTSRCYFFTATLKYTPSDKGRGMNNVDLYGDKLYVMTPRQAIDLGKMVRPRLHIVTTNDVYNLDDYEKSLNKIIKDSFEQHQEVLRSFNQNPKLLISTKGTSDIYDFITSTEFRDLRFANVDIYAISSNPRIGNYINGEQVNRQEFLRRLKRDGINRDKKLIVLHYDILAEGIDVSGFTGIMPLRTLNKSKFLQTFGRSARLDIEDRRKIETKEIKPSDLDKMNKPYAYVIIPNIVYTNEDDMVNVRNIITELREYNFNPAEDILLTSLINGMPEIEQLTGLNNVVKNSPNIGNLIENLEYELEAEKNAKLKKRNMLQKLLTI